ncbi:MAG: nitrogenase iron-molybdenum cofactor biosynthesis protein NifE [Oscillospiraceae bacterium]|jgi:nitrogenase molybdenum-cofactor synthesis protein NifE|nr:nitrogenase iron-molybdenum cofactor biosynthesis protein NifE [Oscillospiraceae bacterium]
MNTILEERKSSIRQGGDGSGMGCERGSVAGAVSQRACVYCGARVVLNPITDAFHIVHGPIGCASYTWDIRGSLTSGSERYRNSYSTDLREQDVIFGGAKKLSAAIDELAEHRNAKLVFVYATCIAGVIGDDVDAVCREAERKHDIRAIPVKAPGFSGTKSQGYRMACDALMRLILPHKSDSEIRGVNILGDFNLAGEMWIIKNYLERLGIPVVSAVTGDASYETLIKMPMAQLNLVQCAGSVNYLAKLMEAEFGTPYIKVSFFGIEDIGSSLIRTADALGDARAARLAREFIAEKEAELAPFSARYRPHLEGKRAAIFVGGGFKAISLIRQFSAMGIETVVVGTQTGQPEDYELIGQLVGSDAVILDDANPSELEQFMREKGADILVGGVKERPLAYKLGIAFCDHNHERKHALAGYEGIENFTREIHLSMNSPVRRYMEGGI